MATITYNVPNRLTVTYRYDDKTGEAVWYVIHESGTLQLNADGSVIRRTGDALRELAHSGNVGCCEIGNQEASGNGTTAQP